RANRPSPRSTTAPANTSLNQRLRSALRSSRLHTPSAARSSRPASERAIGPRSVTPGPAIDRAASGRVRFARLPNPGAADRAMRGGDRGIEAQATDELGAWLRTAATLSRAGDRTAAIAALGSAVRLAPDDPTAPRRLAAAYAIAGDGDRAHSEYDRFIARLEARGALDAAAVERSYA